MSNEFIISRRFRFSRCCHPERNEAKSKCNRRQLCGDTNDSGTYYKTPEFCQIRWHHARCVDGMQTGNMILRLRHIAASLRITAREEGVAGWGHGGVR
jgi:hypothetical protein